MAKTLQKWQFGDFQTPESLAIEAVKLLKNTYCLSPDIILEPSCGKGAFIQAAVHEFSDTQIIGLDINSNYIEQARKLLCKHPNFKNITLQCADFFDTDWNTLISTISGNLLVLGNPPWVTSSELSLINSQNVPAKSNFHNRRGIEAITGSGNFDISEWMLLQYLQWIFKNKGTIAVLCKRSVARKIITPLLKDKSKSFLISIHAIDAKKHFDASVEACLLVISNTLTPNLDCRVYPSLQSCHPSEIIGERDGFLLRKTNQYEKWRHLLGQDLRYIWRSGIKHDCAKVMELQPVGDRQFTNGFKQKYCLEPTYLYPLLKSSDLNKGQVESCRKFVLVTQKSIGEDTRVIQNKAPQTWQYLLEHAPYLNHRKSSIYKNKPSYSIFGVGAYSFKPWKVAISGLYKRLNFCLVSPLGGKPVMFDDTVSFLSFDSEEEAKFVFSLVTSKPALEFLDSIIFWDNKRPIAIDVLRRLSLKAVARELGVFERYQHWLQAVQISENGQLELGLF